MEETLHDNTRLVLSRIRIFRAKDWIHFLGLPLLSVDWKPMWPLDAAIGIVLSALCLAFAYSWNNVHDSTLDSDRVKNPLARSSNPGLVRRARIYSLIPAGLAVAISATLGWYRFALVTTCILGSAAYSAGPRLKAIPVVGTVTNLLIFAPLTLLGSRGPFPDTMALMLIASFSLMLLQNQLLHEATDIKDDSKGGIRTSAALLGDLGTRIAATAMGAGALLMLFIAGFSNEWGYLVSWEVLPLLAVTASIPLMKLSDLRVAGLMRWFHKVAGLVSGLAVWVTIEFLPHVLPR
jgi:4-hydroxybenzoate polyprenyltransferase